ncbi:hypothetical protein [Corynebacterium flavescens]|uniref:hypothetical protein n=1 Tax=Corynebacterium flavescens TaxID=28028 RepID=UPI00289BABD0|nr:hypothetical protein [Corynebacterium flavescens]
MDLSTIIDHLDNFVTTWKGWGAVIDAIFGAHGENDAARDGGILGINWKESFEGVSSATKGLSSTSSK